MRISLSMLGRDSSVRLSMPTCCSTLGCTASPLISGFSTDCVSTNTRAEASYLSGATASATSPAIATTHAAAMPTSRRRHMPRTYSSAS